MIHRTGSLLASLATLTALLSACGGGGASAADEKAVTDDLAALTLTFANGDTADHVTVAFSVPLAGSAGSTYTWRSASPTLAADASGRIVVTRPSYDAADATAVLTATASKGQASGSRGFTVTVIRFGQTAAEKTAAFAMDKASIAPSLAAGDTLDGVRHDFRVPMIAPSGSTIIWSSSDPSITIDAKGNVVVTRPASGPDLLVTLTATLSNGVAVDTRSFVMTVKEGSSATRMAEDVAWVLSNRVKIFGNDPYQVLSPAGAMTYYPVHADFTVPLVGPSGSALAWDASVSNGRIVSIDAQGHVSLLHHPGFGTTIQDRGFLVFTAAHGGLRSSAQISELVFSYHLTDPQEAVAWDRIVAGYAISAAAQFPTPVGTTNYPYSLTYPPAVPSPTRTVSYTTNRSFTLRADLTSRSGTTITWKSSDESVIAINNLTGAAVVKPNASQHVVNLIAVFTKDGFGAESPYYLEVTVPPAPAAPVIRYTDLDYKLPVGKPFDIAAVSLGNLAAQCSVAPALPAGLTLTHSANYPCRISGTPTTEQPRTLYTVTATDSLSQTGTTELYLTVGGAGVNTVLESLGVKPSAAAALADRNGNPLPPDYNPLRRKNVSFFNVKELFAVGEPTMLHGIYDNLADMPPAAQRPATLMELGADANAWMTNAVKSGTAGDFDGDGFDEVVLVRLQDTGGATGDVVIESVQDKSSGYARAHVTLTGLADYFKTEGTDWPGEVDVTAADIDGDGKDELIVGLGVRSYRDMPDYRTTGPEVWYASATGTAKLLILDDADAGFALLAQKSLGSGLARSIYVAAADATGSGIADQIAVSLMVGSEARYTIYSWDRGAHTLQEEAAGPIEVKEGDTVYRPMLADVVAADFNRNGVPEFVFAGVEWPSEAKPDTRYVAMAVERAGKSYAVLPGAKHWIDYTSADWKPGAFAFSSACAESRTCDYIKVLDVFAEALDVDGDLQPDLLINNKVFDAGFNVKLDKGGNEMSVWGLMNNQNVGMTAYDQGNNPYVGYNPFTAFNRSNTWIAVGDFNGDHREDIAYWGRNRPDGLQVWGVDANGAFGQLGWYDTGNQHADNQNRGYPVLVGANVDDDSMVVSFNHSDVIFTEPMPIAAVAAAPCWGEGSGQTLYLCGSSFGKGSSVSTATEDSFSVHASVSVGYQTPLGGLGVFSVEAHATATVNSDFTFGSEHSVDKSVTFSGGENEDIVVFMTVPYDVYYYDVISAPDPAGVGNTFMVRVPRRPRTQQAERSYYNRSVAAINPNRVIGSETFTHVVAQPSSYPTAATRSSILNANGGGLTHGPVAVPQGGGSTALSLGVSDTSSQSTALSFDLTVEVQTTVMDTLSLGVSLGGGYGRDITVSSTENSTYGGSVGAIDAANYPGKSYSFGIFAYTQQNHPSGFKFHTVNFWVE
jgi:hypothetical protein